LLELHKEKVPILKYIRESVSLFNVQARDCGLTLQILSKPFDGVIDIPDDVSILLDHPPFTTAIGRRVHSLRTLRHRMPSMHALSRPNPTWPAADPTQCPLDGEDFVDIDQFKIEQVRETALVGYR
jgi:hypothetical protein